MNRTENEKPIDTARERYEAQTAAAGESLEKQEERIIRRDGFVARPCRRVFDWSKLTPNKIL